MRKFLLALVLATPAFAAAPTLSSIAHPPMQIGTATVVDSSGRILGAVQRVEVTPDGRPTEVALAPINDRNGLLVLNASKLRYDADSNRIIVD